MIHTTLNENPFLLIRITDESNKKSTLGIHLKNLAFFIDGFIKHLTIKEQALVSAQLILQNINILLNSTDYDDLENNFNKFNNDDIKNIEQYLQYIEKNENDLYAFKPAE